MVRYYDAPIRFFVDVLQFELVEDTPSLTNDGRPKRWVVVRPDGGQAGILLARADGDEKMGSVGQQFAGRVPAITTQLLTAILWAGAALLACYVPAARAARVDPLVALRHE